MARQSEGAPRRATIIANPIARRVRKRWDGEAAARYIERRGFVVRLEHPGSAAEMRAAARASAERGDDLLFVAGGDGSLREAAAGLAGSDTALAALPGGTSNVWVKETGIPRGFRAAVDAHLAGQTVHIDLGRANGEPFLLMAGIGWDAAIASRVNPAIKRRTGPLAYVIEGARELPGLHPRPLRWRSGALIGEAPVAVMIISNTRLYGGVVQFSKGANARDGLLDLVALTPHTRRDGAVLAIRLALGRLHGHAHVLESRVSELDVETAGIPYQLDGDPVGVSPIHFTIEPHALRVSVPAGELPPVLGP